MKAEIRKKLATLRRTIRHLGLGITKRGNSYMVFRIVDSHVVFGAEPTPWSQDLASVECYLSELKKRLDRGEHFPAMVIKPGTVERSDKI